MHCVCKAKFVPLCVFIRHVHQNDYELRPACAVCLYSYRTICIHNWKLWKSILKSWIYFKMLSLTYTYIIEHFVRLLQFYAKLQTHDFLFFFSFSLTANLHMLLFFLVTVAHWNKILLYKKRYKLHTLRPILLDYLKKYLPLIKKTLIHYSHWN